MLGQLRGDTLKQHILAALSHYRDDQGRIAVAYSGGGDSTALLHMLSGFEPLAVIIDHNLSSGSAERTAIAVKRAKKMGVEIVERLWDAPPPNAMQRHARIARYALLGEVCREHGITTLVTAHTLDDQAETAMMTDGQSLMRPVTYAPVWPGLRDVEVNRPALLIRRAALREYNRDHGLDWIEDPANKDDSYTRVRTRRELVISDDQANELIRHTPLSADEVQHAEDSLSVLNSCVFLPGTVATPRELDTQFCRFLAMCVSGNAELGMAFKLLDRTQTTNGVLIEPHGDRLIWARDPGAILGRSDVTPLVPMALRTGAPTIWDGRILITAKRDGLMVKPIGEDPQAKAMNPNHRARRTLPGIYDGEELIALPGHGDSAEFVDLSEPRLRRILDAHIRSGS